VTNSGIAVPAGIMMAAKRVNVESFIVTGGWLVSNFVTAFVCRRKL
jgi:hypothetical protein